MAELEVKGLKEILDKVREMGRLDSKIENAIITKAAEPILKEAVENAPEKSGKGKMGLKISRPKSANGTKYVLVGIDRGDISEIFYMKFHEFGTSKIPARPFLGPAYERNKDKAVEIIREELKRLLGL